MSFNDRGSFKPLTDRKIMRTLVSLSLALVLIAAASGCEMCACGRPNPSSAMAAPFDDAWHDVYGKVCSEKGANPSPGCNYYAPSGGYSEKIWIYADPYVPSFTNPHEIMTYSNWEYFDGYGAPKTYEGWAWRSQDGILYNEDGDALNSMVENRTRDRALWAAKEEQKKTRLAAEKFRKEHPLLSEAGTFRIANNLQAWATLAKDRRFKKSRTERDIQDFSLRIFGVAYQSAESAVRAAQTGDPGKLLDLVGEVGNYWGDSSPNREETQAVLIKWYGKSLTRMGMNLSQ